MIEQKQLAVAKELDDCLLALKSVLEDVKGKKPLGDILAGSLPKLISAFEGLDKIDDELAQDMGAFAATAGYRVGELVGVMLKKPLVAKPA